MSRSGGNLVGQGNHPELWALYSTDDATDTDPTWVDATTYVRSFSVSRGRESELQQIEAGTATITLDNGARTFDPAVNTGIRPLNRWWIREQFSGETQSLFYGFAERYDQTTDRSDFDTIARVDCVDVFKLLNLDALPTTDPPRASYAELVASDNPAGYYPFNDPPEVLVQTAADPPGSPESEEPPTPTPALPPPRWLNPHIGDPWA